MHTQKLNVLLFKLHDKHAKKCKMRKNAIFAKLSTESANLAQKVCAK